MLSTFNAHISAICEYGFLFISGNVHVSKVFHDIVLNFIALKYLLPDNEFFTCLKTVITGSRRFSF